MNDADPDLIVTERLPVILSNAQATSARIALTVLRVVAYQQGFPWQEIAASTVKKQLTGAGKASKVKVRNAVLTQFPELEYRRKTIIADETDAIAIGIIAARKYE